MHRREVEGFLRDGGPSGEYNEIFKLSQQVQYVYISTNRSIE